MFNSKAPIPDSVDEWTNYADELRAHLFKLNEEEKADALSDIEKILTRRNVDRIVDRDFQIIKCESQPNDAINWISLSRFEAAYRNGQLALLFAEKALRIADTAKAWVISARVCLIQALIELQDFRRVEEEMKKITEMDTQSVTIDEIPGTFFLESINGFVDGTVIERYREKVAALRRTPAG